MLTPPTRKTSGRFRPACPWCCRGGVGGGAVVGERQEFFPGHLGEQEADRVEAVAFHRRFPGWEHCDREGSKWPDELRRG